MLGVVATLKVKPGMEQQFESVAKELVAKVNASEPGCMEAHRATEHFKTLGRKMGEFMDGRPEVLRLREVE
jgi:quinol monooxygenase YgiN